MGAGTNQAASLWVPGSEHNWPHFRQMPTLGGIRLATCLEPLRLTSSFPGLHLKRFSADPQSAVLLLAKTRAFFPGAQTLRAKMPFANLSAPSRAGGSRGVPSLALDY